jgi:hypothetical protein
MTDQAMGRQLLHIRDARHVGLRTYDAKDPDTSFPPIVPLRPPAGPPNVLVNLLDDVGFGSSSTFGDSVDTPNFERLARGGAARTPSGSPGLQHRLRTALWLRG